MHEDPAAIADHESRAFALWVTAAIMLSPTAWIHYLVLLILTFMLIAAAGWNASASPRAVWLMAGSYAVLSLSMALAGGAQSSLADRPYLKAALEECATLSLLLAYASAWFSPLRRHARFQALVDPFDADPGKGLARVAQPHSMIHWFVGIESHVEFGAPQSIPAPRPGRAANPVKSSRAVLLKGSEQFRFVTRSPTMAIAVFC
jgi:hypothetical protein